MSPQEDYLLTKIGSEQIKRGVIHVFNDIAISSHVSSFGGRNKYLSSKENQI
jgi:hypothetical protein